ncbi:MAG TPA: hypothetical protein VHF69_04925 [Candidatus Synoicihabitans sp.]|nr:hypothetical protein [Candidatus Synoicihabitans sp.]
MHLRLLLVLFAALPLTSTAQDLTRRAAQGDTVLMMPIGLHTFTASTFASRVRVPPLESVRMQVPDWVPEPIQWTKDQTAIPGATGRTLELHAAAASDSGHYGIQSGLTFPYYAPGIRLEVLPSGNVSNVSARFELSPGSPPQILGFAVNGDSPKLLLVRAVGPSLAAFGVARPAAQPRLEVFDAAGRRVSFAHPAVLYDFAAFFRSVGAFPLTGAEPFGLAFDFGTLSPGTYSLVVSDASGAGGTVLAEVYEASAAPPVVVTTPTS